MMDTTLEETIEKGVNSITGNPERKEGKVARFIEAQTSKLPSDLFLWASFTSMAASLTLKILKLNHTALFVGQWAPSFLILGLYNKLVKVGGHD
jgi:hypothetical protein